MTVEITQHLHFSLGLLLKNGMRAIYTFPEKVRSQKRMLSSHQGH